MEGLKYIKSNTKKVWVEGMYQGKDAWIILSMYRYQCVCVSVYMSMNLRVYECLHCVCMYMSKDMNENNHGNMQAYTIT